MQAESIYFSPKPPKIWHIQHSWHAVNLKRSFFCRNLQKFEHFLTHLALQVKSSQFFAEISENLNYPPLFACIRRVKAFIFRRNLQKFELSNTHGMHSFFRRNLPKNVTLIDLSIPLILFIYSLTRSFFRRNLRKFDLPQAVSMEVHGRNSAVLWYR